MAINEWRIWKRLGIAKEEEVEEVKVKDDLGAVISFLKEINLKELARKLEIMKEIVREGGVVDKELKSENLDKQIKLFDKILRDYDFFVNDADINGLRLKKIGGELLRKAEESGMNELVKEKKNEIMWR
jgi:hypothetical protein